MLRNSCRIFQFRFKPVATYFTTSSRMLKLILSIADMNIPVTEIVTNLVAAANDAGGHDNISCIGVNL